MAEDHIRYDVLAQEALRGVVRKVLAEVARTGLPGAHHFYITFDTRAPGVRISPGLRERYPQEMTIVLQHQFWDLEVNETAFEVGLSFSGVPEHLVVPFTAIKGFADPSVNFGVQFIDLQAEARDGGAGQAGSVPQEGEAAPQPLPEDPAPAAPARSLRSRGKRKPAEPEEAPSTEKEKSPSGEATVVSLDAFRRKN